MAGGGGAAVSRGDIYDQGLQFDLSTLLDRRRILGLFGAVGLATLVGCASDSASDTARATGTGGTTTPMAASSSAATGADCAEIPEETAGPYPGDGSNGPNVLAESGIVRSDIRSSFGSASGRADGVPLDIDLTVLDAANGCVPWSGAAVYLWQCDRDGNYSMYSQPIATENYLRGVQEADAAGGVGFTSIFPACYSGRWPHIHFEVYPSLADASSAANKIATSQLAFAEDISQSVYATSGYEQSVQNLAQVSLDTDNVFGDGHDTQLGTVTGDITSGLTVSLTVAV
jgi:protocatechuate 3,4-dioxygenase beta subunit